MVPRPPASFTDGEKLFMITNDKEKILSVMERQFVLSLGLGSLVQKLSGRVQHRVVASGGKRGRTMRRLDEKPVGSA